MICFGLAGLCVLYFIVVALFTGLQSKFHVIWLVIAAAFVFLEILIRLQSAGRTHIPQFVCRGVQILAAVCILLFLITAAQIVIAANTKPEPDAEYVLILGAQVRGTRPSSALKGRLDAGLSYFRENPDVVFVVSGAQGSGELITEAEAMSAYLQAAGVAKEQIIKEEKSYNTDQNILYSRRLAKLDEQRTVLVTSRFHVYRSLGICRKQGMKKVQGLGSKELLVMYPSYYLREVMAVWKYRFTGRL